MIIIVEDKTQNLESPARVHMLVYCSIMPPSITDKVVVVVVNAS